MSTIEDVIEGRANWCVVERDALAVLADLPNGCVDALITDPPYGMSFQSWWCKDGPRFDRIVGDDQPAVEFLPAAVKSMRQGGAAFVFCEWRRQEVFRFAMESAGLTVRSQCIWDREVHGMGDLGASFAPCHDVGWFATSGDGFGFHATRPQSVLRFQRVAANRLSHPAEKPIALMRHLVRCLAPRGGLILDPFGGSGTTAVAAVLEGRRAITCEIVPEHAETARKRLAAAEAGTDFRNPQQGGLFAKERA